MQQEEPLFRFGLIADIQYADIDVVAQSFWGRPRYFADALQKASKAALAWKEHKCNFAINLGDIIDRRSNNHCGDLRAVSKALAQYPVVHHCIGNHELSSIPRHELVDLLQLPFPAYHTFQAVPGWRIVILDTYDLALKSWPEDHPQHRETLALMERGKQEHDLNRRRPFMDHPEMNGGLGRKQLAWLQQEVDMANEAGEKLIVATHCPLYPYVTVDGYAVCWNYTDVMEILHCHPGQTVLCLSGHDHEGAHRVDSRTGVHHVLLEAALEAPLHVQSHAIVEVYDSRISVKGAGNVRSHEIQFQAYNEYCSEIHHSECPHVEWKLEDS